MRAATVPCTVLAVVLGAAGAGAEQATRAPEPESPPRAYLSINGGAQLTRTDFTGDLSFPLYQENAEGETRYEVPAGPMIDIGAGVRIAGGLAVGAAVTRFQQRASGTIAVRLPHPLLPETPRLLVEAIDDLDRVETAVHAYAAWLVPAGEHLTIAVFGGPTFFRVEQDIVSGLELDETYPFDQASLRTAQIVQEDGSATGFNVGADVMYRLTRSAGVGGVARYSRGTLDAGIGDLQLGGLQFTGGVRWIF